MPTFAGLRGTGSFAADERPKNFREFILFRDPNGRTPLTALLAKMKMESVNDPEFSWWEEKLNIVRVSINGALTDTDTTFVVDSGANALIPGDVLQVEKAEVANYGTYEFVTVTAVASDTSFTVARGAAGSTAANIPDDAFLTRVGTAFGEGTGSASPTSANPTKLVNFTQIFKTAFSVTNTAIPTKLRTGDLLKNERKRKTFEHAEKIEQALFWGRPNEAVDTNGQPIRHMGGLRHYLTTNTQVFGAGIDEDQLLDAIAPIFNFHGEGAGDERIAFVGNLALNNINKIARNSPSTRITFSETISNVYGMNLMKLLLPQGTIYLKTHPLLNVHPVYQRSMFIINPTGLIYRPLEGRDTKVEENIQLPGEDIRKDQWLTECGLEIHHEETMAYLGNITPATP